MRLARAEHGDGEPAGAIYYRVHAHETFGEAAKALLLLVREAQAARPGVPRTLYLDIDGHRNAAGGFDRDMMELQKEFALGFLGQFLTELHLPLGTFRPGKPQRDDVPDRLDIFNAGDVN